MIVVYNRETLKIIVIENEKNDVLLDESAGPIVAEEIIDDALIGKVWQAMSIIIEQCNVELDGNGKITDIKIITPYLGEDR